MWQAVTASGPISRAATARLGLTGPCAPNASWVTTRTTAVAIRATHARLAPMPIRRAPKSCAPCEDGLVTNQTGRANCTRCEAGKRYERRLPSGPPICLVRPPQAGLCQMDPEQGVHVSAPHIRYQGVRWRRVRAADGMALPVPGGRAATLCAPARRRVHARARDNWRARAGPGSGVGDHAERRRSSAFARTFSRRWVFRRSFCSRRSAETRRSTSLLAEPPRPATSSSWRASSSRPGGPRPYEGVPPPRVQLTGRNAPPVAAPALTPELRVLVSESSYHRVAERLRAGRVWRLAEAIVYSLLWTPLRPHARILPSSGVHWCGCAR